MLKPLGLRRLVILLVGLTAPVLLQGGANAWVGSRPSGTLLTDPTLIASSAQDPDVVYSAQDGEIFGSTDGGRSWARLGAFDNVYSLYVLPTSSSTLLAGAFASGSLAGIYKSDDGGLTWTQTLVQTDHVFVYSFAAAASNPSVVYAGADTVYMSRDAGVTWAPVNRPAAEDLRLSQTIAALVINPADDTTPEVGGYDYSYYSTLRPFFRTSPDEGDTWSDFSTGLGDYGSVSAIAIDPVHPSTILVGMTRSPASAVFRSDDGGASWTPAQNGLPAHTEIEALAMDPHDPRTLYASSSSGVFRTRDGGASWIAVGQQLDGTEVTSLSFDASGRFLRAGTRFGASVLEIGAGALDVAAGPGRSHVLSWDADRLSVRTLEDSGEDASTPPEGPYGGWAATAISDGADGLSRVLWVNGDGRAALEIVGAAGSQAVYRFAGQSPYSAADVSVRADGMAHLLWTGVTGAMYLTSVDAAGNETLGPGYGPYGNWTAIALDDAPDGSTQVLWRATDGRFSISVHHGLAMSEVLRFPAIADRAAADISIASDGNARVLLVGADGTAEVATVDALGSLTDDRAHTDPGFRPRRIAAGPDGLTRLLWSDDSGGARVSLLGPNNTVQAQRVSSRSAGDRR